MIHLLALQLILPLTLLAVLVFSSKCSRAGLALQIAGTLATLLALHLSGLWLMPPWWAIWVYWLIFGGALYRACSKLPPSWLPRGALGWTAAISFAALTTYAGSIALKAWEGRQRPGGQLVQLRFPLEQGHYLVANGGTNTTVSSHARTFARATPRQRHYYGQSHAVDVVAISSIGLSARGFEPADARRYLIFGHGVLAPCAGQIIQTANDSSDMQVPTMDAGNMVGNHVLLRCASADILLAHFRRGSVTVRPGDFVQTGQVLAEAGNSGNSSAPHLHIHAQEPGTADAPFSGKPLPMLFAGRYLVRGDRL